MTNYSINKEEILKGKSLLVDNTENVKSYKLFKDYNSSENTVFVVEKYNSTDNFPKSIKDLSFMLLKENAGNFSEYFINEDMREEYEKGNIEDVLELRRELIINAERAFVESLGIEYYG